MGIARLGVSEETNEGQMTYQRGEFGDKGDVLVPCTQDQVLVPGDNAKEQDLNNYGFQRKPGGCRAGVAQERRKKKIRSGRR